MTKNWNPFELMPVSKWREHAKDLYFFSREILSTGGIEKFLDWGVIHKHLCNFLMVSKRPSLRKLISVFRGSYKTTVLLGYVTWLFVWHVVLKKPISICYNTATKDNALLFMEEFRNYLTECKFLYLVFPDFPRPQKKKPWVWTNWRVEYKWVKFHVSSNEVKQVSRHYTVYINDDVVNDDNAFSDKERETTKRKWKFQKSILTKHRKKKIGYEIDVGTPYHPHDIMSDLVHKIKRYDKFVVPYALKDDGTCPDPWDREGAWLTFPEMFDWEDFEDKYEDQGASIFNTQYKLQILDEADVLCKESWLREWRFLPEKYVRHMIVDPAGTENKDNSATGITVCDFDETGTMYVIYAQRFWLTPYNLIKKMEEIKDEFQPDETYVEREKYSTTIADTLDHLQVKLDFDFVDPKNQPKEKRIYKLKGPLETGKILIKDHMRELKAQLLNYPDGDNDILDSLAYQWMKREKPERIKSHEREIFSEPTFEDEINKIIELHNDPGENQDAFF